MAVLRGLSEKRGLPVEEPRRGDDGGDGGGDARTGRGSGPWGAGAAGSGFALDGPSRVPLSAQQRSAYTSCSETAGGDGGGDGGGGLAVGS